MSEAKYTVEKLLQMADAEAGACCLDPEYIAVRRQISAMQSEVTALRSQLVKYEAEGYPEMSAALDRRIAEVSALRSQVAAAVRNLVMLKDTIADWECPSCSCPMGVKKCEFCEGHMNGGNDLASFAQSWENNIRAEVWEEAAKRLPPCPNKEKCPRPFEDGVTFCFVCITREEFRLIAASLRNPAPAKPEDKKCPKT